LDLRIRTLHEFSGKEGVTFGRTVFAPDGGSGVRVAGAAGS